MFVLAGSVIEGATRAGLSFSELEFCAVSVFYGPESRAVSCFSVVGARRAGCGMQPKYPPTNRPPGGIGVAVLLPVFAVLTLGCAVHVCVRITLPLLLLTTTTTTSTNNVASALLFGVSGLGHVIGMRSLRYQVRDTGDTTVVPFAAGGGEGAKTFM